MSGHRKPKKPTNWMKVARKLVKVDFRNEPRSADIGEYHRRVEELSGVHLLQDADPDEQLIDLNKREKLIAIYKQLPWTRDYIFHYSGYTPGIASVVFRYDPHELFSVFLCEHMGQEHFVFDGKKYDTVNALKRAIRAKSKYLRDNPATPKQIAALRKAEVKVVQILDKIAYQKSTNPLRWEITNKGDRLYVTKRRAIRLRGGVSQRRMEENFRVFAVWRHSQDYLHHDYEYTPYQLIPFLQLQLRMMGVRNHKLYEVNLEAKA